MLQSNRSTSRLCQSLPNLMFVPSYVISGLFSSIIKSRDFMVNIFKQLINILIFGNAIESMRASFINLFSHGL